MVELYILLAEHPNPPGIVNGVSGAHDTQKSFAKAIGARAGAKLYLNIPELFLWLRFGSFGKEMLVDQDVRSEVHSDINYQPQFTSLEQSIAHHLT